MLLWLVIIALSAATAVALGWPLLRPSKAAPLASSDAGSRAVYADQLAEIDADLSRGLIAPADAEAAKIEISRRILAQASGTADLTGTSGVEAVPAAVRFGLIALVPIAAAAVYAAIGSPSLPARPFSAVAQHKGNLPGAQDIDKLVAQVEARLREVPDDGRGWEVLGPVYMRQQRFDEARQAFNRAIALLGESPRRLSSLGEAAIKAAGGDVTDEARNAFERLLKLEPGRTEAKFWLAMAREQRGELAQAAEEYRALLAAAPADAPWRAVVEERLAAVSGKPQDKPAAPSPAARGPTEKDIAGAAAMSPEARQQMIAGMVDGLHQRLKADGRDAEGWQKLLRAYNVMGARDKAKAALAEARQALAADSAGLGAIEAVAREIGLGS